MPALRRQASLALVALNLVFACGGSENDWPVQPTPPYTYTSYLGQLPEYACDHIMNCPSPGADIAESRILFVTISHCTEVLAAALRRTPGTFDPEPDIKSGRIVFQADKARAYLAHLGGDCDSSAFAVDPSAGGGLEGTVEAGSPCNVDVECRSGNYCDHQSGACPGTCAPAKSDGDPCQADAECASAYCGTSGACEKLTKAPPGAAGDACGLQTGATATLTVCGAGLFCEGYPSGHCRTPIPADAPCSDPSDLCALGHLCLIDVDGTERCRPVSVVGQGELCTGENGPDVRICDAISLLTCENSKCVSVASGAEGSPCVRNDYVDSCGAGLVCSTATHLCKKLGQAGGTCTESADCASGYCRPGSGTCSAEFCE